MEDSRPTSHIAPAAVRETHSGVVILLGDRAFKLKKPVKLEFLDFSTPQLRDQACRREVRLNRRLAPDVYLGVATVADVDGLPCESMVVMRRMPDDRRLSSLVAAGVDVSADLRRLARDIAAFHATARTNREISEAGSPERLADRWRSNVEDLRRRGLAASCADLIWREATAYIEGRRPLLAERMSEQLVRDGHGDLLADDVFCLPDGPRALDCLDFDPELRWMDVLDDVACLAMDLEDLGAPALAGRFTADYAEFSGGHHPPSLLHHYIAYRAVMRAKVTAIRLQQAVSTSPSIADPVYRLLRLGVAHLAEAQVRLLLVGGAPATGKTTLAAAFADVSGGVLLSSDRTRKELLGLEPESRHPAPYRSGIYTSSVTDRTYQALADRATQALSMGESVVVDASFAMDRHRRIFRSLAERVRARVVEVRCEASPAVVKARLAARTSAHDRYTDAGPEIGERMAQDADPWPQAVTLDTRAAVPELVSQVRQSWEPAWQAED
jgi:aminoglycoside phosphotransferase family enzyme/predicted kinase